MNKHKIAIIGANESIDFLINRAKEKGYETHVFAWQVGDPGEKSADFFYPISVADKEKILEVCKNLQIDGVASITSDFAVNTVNYVARNLGLTCNSEKSDYAARDKYEMRKALKEAGLYTPWFIKIDKNTDLECLNNIIFPVIVKPIDLWSSKGISKVNNFSELKESIDYAISVSLSGEAIIESFIEGPEYSAECICQNGECHILAYTKKTTTGYPHYIEICHSEPAEISANLLPMLNNTIKKAVKSLGITNSAAHAEFKILENDEIGIIEIGARTGGGCIGTDLVKLSTGYDYLGMVIDVACGKPLDFSKSNHYKNAYVTFFLSNDDVQKYYQLSDKEKENVERMVDHGHYNSNPTNNADRHGYYIIRY